MILASSIVCHLSLQAPMSRTDRLVVLFILSIAYTSILVAVRVILIGGQAVLVHLFGGPHTLKPPAPWELYIGVCGLLINLAFVMFGYKDVLSRELTWPMQLREPLQAIGVGILLATLLLVFRLLPFRRWMNYGSRTVGWTVILGLPLLTLFPPDVAPRATALGASLPDVARLSRRPLLLFGLDGVDWQILRASLRTGRLPNIEKAVSEGTTSTLDNEDFGFSPPVWTTIITGQSRQHHQIYDFVTRRSPVLTRPLDAWWEKIPPGFGIKSTFNLLTRIGIVEERLTDGRDRRGPSLWQILSRFDYRNLVINYQIGNPAEEIKGIFLMPGSAVLEETTAALRTVSLGPLRGVNRQIRVDFELTADDFARSAAVTLGILRSESFDLVTFYTSWPDWFNHLMSLEDYDNVLAGHFEKGFPAALIKAYERLDDLVGRLRTAQPAANILIISDHGVGVGYKFRQRRLQHVFGCPGIFIAQGPDVVPTGPVPAVAMYDLAPTILAYFGVPRASDMPGRVRADVLEMPVAPQPGWVVESYEAAVANRRRSPNSGDSDGILERLRTLGYVQP